MKLILLLATILAFSVFGIGESFSSQPTPPPGFTEMKINTLPVLNEEFELTISLVPRNYNSEWEEASDDKTWPVTFSVTLPKSFEIIDDDFSKKGNYGFKLPEDYQTISVTRDVGFPPQTTVKLKPTEPGLWQIIANGDMFISGKIFVTLTENYSYLSDKSSHINKRETCNQESTYYTSDITVLDLNSNTIENNIQDEFMKEHHKDWEILGNSATGLAYIYEYYTTTIPIIDLNSGETKDYLTFDNSVSDMVRIADLAINPETNLIYLANTGRLDYSDYGSLIVIDGNTHSVISTIKYLDSDEDEIDNIAINPKTNTLYGMSRGDNLYVIDLNTEQILSKLHLGNDDSSYTYIADMKVNSKTNKIYVLDSGDNPKIHVINGHTNNLLETLPSEKGQSKMAINEKTNEIYARYGNMLHVIDGTDSSQIKEVELYDSSFAMDFDSVDEKLYISNADSSITVIDTNGFDFDVIHNCSQPSGIFLDSEKDKLYLVGDETRSSGNVLDSVQIPNSAEFWISDLHYPRTEYLIGEDVDFMISKIGGSNIILDYIFIKNLDNDNTVFTFSELKSLSGKENMVLSWNQLDNTNNKVASGNYALILKGHDDNNSVYGGHKLFSIIDQNKLDDFKSLHKEMFSYLELNDKPSENTDELDDLTSTSNTDDLTSKSTILPDDITCKNNFVSVTKNHEKYVCVKTATSEKLVLRGWEIISREPHVDISDVPSKSIQDIKRDLMHEFPLSNEVIDNGIGRFNVEFSHKPVLNEDFNITMKFEFLDDETSNKKSNKAIPFTLTLGDGIEYVRGNLEEIERKYSLVTEKYNTIYEGDTPKTTPNLHKSTSTLKFLQSGVHYLAAYVNTEHFDTFWFFVDDDGTVNMIEKINYDYRALSQLMQNLVSNNPESIESELEDIFGNNAKRVLEEYYERFEYERPIAPVDISTTKVQLRDVICPDDIFYKFTQEDWKSHGGIRCGSESTLEYYSGISLDAYDRDEAMKILTVNTNSETMSEESIFVDSRNIENLHNEWNFGTSVNEEDAILPPPYHYPGQHCSNNALYATFEVPEQVKVGETFDVILTYNWKMPNSNWDVMSEKDKNTMQNLRDEYIPLAKVEEMVKNNQKTLTEKELDDLDDQMDGIHDQMEEILDEYDLDDSDFNIYGYQIAEYYPECDDPLLSFTFPEEMEILSDEFEITSSQGKHKLVEYLGQKILSFSNDHPRTSIVTMIVNEPTFNLVNYLNIDTAGHRKNFVFSVDNDTVTFAHNPDYLERLSFTPNIDKFGNKIPRHEQNSGNGYSLDIVLYEYYQLHDMSNEEAQQLQLEFMKHKVLNPDDDFTTFYKIFSGKDISDEIDYVKLGPPMEDFAEFIREHISNDEEDIEEWLYSENDLHDDWIEEFLKQYPEFKN